MSTIYEIQQQVDFRGGLERILQCYDVRMDHSSEDFPLCLDVFTVVLLKDFVLQTHATSIDTSSIAPCLAAA